MTASLSDDSALRRFGDLCGAFAPPGASLARYAAVWADVQRRPGGLAPTGPRARRVQRMGGSFLGELFLLHLADIRGLLSSVDDGSASRMVLANASLSVDLAAFHLLQRHALAAARSRHDAALMSIASMFCRLWRRISHSAAIRKWRTLCAASGQSCRALIALDLLFTMVHLTRSEDALVVAPVAYPEVLEDGLADPLDLLIERVPAGRDPLCDSSPSKTRARSMNSRSPLGRSWSSPWETSTKSVTPSSAR